MSERAQTAAPLDVVAKRLTAGWGAVMIAGAWVCTPADNDNSISLAATPAKRIRP